MDVDVLRSSSARITGSFFKNQNLNRYKNLRTLILNNKKKQRDYCDYLWMFLGLFFHIDSNDWKFSHEFLSETQQYNINF